MARDASEKVIKQHRIERNILLNMKFVKINVSTFLFFICLWQVSLYALSCRAEIFPGKDYSLLRERMVAKQLEARDIKDKKVLAAMRKVPRHLFVPENYRHLAYEDYPLPIGEGQTISQPYIVALMTQVINPNAQMKVLEIGTGSGYQAAILAELCAKVYTVEIIEILGERAKGVLQKLYGNVFVRIGDGYQGWPEFAPFDAIIVTCAPTHVPQPLVEQLREGGRMVIPVGEAGAQQLVVLTKNKGKLIEEQVIPVRFVPMVDSKGKKY